MDDRLYRFLSITAVAMAVLWIGWTLYDGLFGERNPGDTSYLVGNQEFSDGRYEAALDEYDKALDADPQHIHALRGRARALIQLERYDQALKAYNEAIRRAPEFAAAYANRGILRDRMGDYRGALDDYDRALELNPELGEGPGWMTRFLRNQAEAPPGIADRADYLRQELNKPAGERVMKRPDADEAQRPYEM